MSDRNEESNERTSERFHTQLAYALGPESNDSTPWCAWQLLDRDSIRVAARHVTRDRDEFRLFAEEWAAVLKPGQTLGEAVAELKSGTAA